MGDFVVMQEKVNNEITDASSPQVIEQFIGQDRVKQLVRVALEASWADGCKFPDTACYGAPGLGKTAVANLISLECGATCKEALGSTFKNISELNSFLLDCSNRDILFVDEIHELKKDLGVVLYRAMENRKIFIKTNNKNMPYSIGLSAFTLIAATTDPHRLPKPLRDRFKLNLYFDYYTTQEIELILRNRTKKLNWQCEDLVFPRISQRSRGIPRVGLRILENSRRVARSQGLDIITTACLEISCLLDGLDNLGLNADERKYLLILSQQNEPVRLGTIAMSMGQSSPRNVSQIIEPYLFRAGLIIKNDKGRIITPKGLNHIRGGSTK